MFALIEKPGYEESSIDIKAIMLIKFYIYPKTVWQFNLLPDGFLTYKVMHKVFC